MPKHKPQHMRRPSATVRAVRAAIVSLAIAALLALSALALIIADIAMGRMAAGW